MAILLTSRFEGQANVYRQLHSEELTEEEYQKLLEHVTTNTEIEHFYKYEIKVGDSSLIFHTIHYPLKDFVIKALGDEKLQS